MASFVMSVQDRASMVAIEVRSLSVYVNTNTIMNSLKVAGGRVLVQDVESFQYPEDVQAYVTHKLAAGVAEELVRTIEVKRTRDEQWYADEYRTEVYFVPNIQKFKDDLDKLVADAYTAGRASANVFEQFYVDTTGQTLR